MTRRGNPPLFNAADLWHIQIVNKKIAAFALLALFAHTAAWAGDGKKALEKTKEVGNETGKELSKTGGKSGKAISKAVGKIKGAFK